MIRQALFRGQWHLEFSRRDENQPGLVDPGTFWSIEPPRGWSYADPFLLRRDGKLFVFFEAYPPEKRGVIAYSEILEPGQFPEPRIALEAPYHLSYPFIFEWEGNVYLLPETHDNGTIELYRAKKFPDEWALYKVLMKDVRFVDPTLHFEAGKWWLFAGARDGKLEEVSELHLFIGDSLLGPWERHPGNPVVRGENCARPAGRLFRMGDQLVRPGQDSSHFYGEAIWLNRVDTLSATEYRESPLMRLGPESLPDSCGTHTLDFDGEWQVQDGFRYVSRFK